MILVEFPNTYTAISLVPRQTAWERGYTAIAVPMYGHGEHDIHGLESHYEYHLRMLLIAQCMVLVASFPHVAWERAYGIGEPEQVHVLNITW